MRVVAFAVIVIAVLSACGDSKQRKIDQTLDRCAAELEATARQGATLTGDVPQQVRDTVVARLARACDPVFPPCHILFDDMVSGRLDLSRVAPRCLAQYCPTLPTPKPALCDNPTTTAADAIDEAAVAVVRYEWGEAAATRLGDRVRAVGPGLETAIARLRARPAAPEPPPEPEPEPEPPEPSGIPASLLVVAEGIWVGAPDVEPTFIPRCTDGNDLVAVADAVCGLTGVDPRALEIAGAGAKYSDLIAVFDMATTEGRSLVALVDRTALQATFPERPPAAKAPGACRTDRGRCDQPRQAIDPGPISIGPSAAPVDVSQAVVVTITADRKILLGSTSVSSELHDGRLTDLHDRLRDRNGDKEDGVLVVQADRAVPGDLIVQVIDTAKAAGFPTVKLAVDRGP